MPWNHMQIEISPADRLIRPSIGPGGLDRDTARAEVQNILDKATRTNGALRPVAETWRRGPKDDTVYAGLLVWAVYEHADEGPRKAAVAWLDDFAQTMRSAGVNATVARLPD